LITDERALEAGLTSPVSALYPSLHLNLGEVYRSLGDVDRARHHLGRGLASVAASRTMATATWFRVGSIDRLNG
jgi:hypothetical protein